MIETNYGWSPDIESRDLEKLFDYSYSGEQWYVPFRDVQERIYQEAELYPEWIPCNVDGYTPDYYYLQNSSSACTAINSAWGIYAALCLQRRKKMEVNITRPFEAWHYATYHALIAKDFSYGGCSIAGMLKAVTDYGILPYEKSGHEVITDNAMVKLGWNTRKGFTDAQQQHQNTAANYQIKATIPETFDDVKNCLKAGYAVPFGTQLAVKLGSDKIYHLTGKTSHCMCYGYYKPGYFGLRNDYGDGLGWIPENEARQQIKHRSFSAMCILDIERTDKVKPIWDIM
jgi:hypothetical protein